MKGVHGFQAQVRAGSSRHQHKHTPRKDGGNKYVFVEAGNSVTLHGIQRPQAATACSTLRQLPWVFKCRPAP